MTPEEADQHFVETVQALPAGPPGGEPDAPARPGSGLTVAGCRDIFEAQLTSRQLDLAARWMQQQGRGYYTIGSAGHEANAAVAAALRPTDPALLHYRSGAFYVRRARQLQGIDPVRDVLLGVAAAAEEPIAGGRHKVFGRHELAVIPQTSTIASHLPRAVGVAFAIPRAAKLGVGSAWPTDAIAVTSLGDASMNHSTAVGALNSACLASYQGLPMPLLVVCEDNGLGISVRTPSGWVRAAYEDRPGVRYFAADGSDPAATYDAARAAVDWVRTRRAPALLHLSVIRLFGHAGSDVETGYRSTAEIASDHPRDPLAGTARLLVESGADVNTPSGNAQRVAPLHSAAAAQDVEIARLLLERGADPNARQAGGFTPLHTAGENGQIEIIRLLLEHGANPAVQAADGKSPADLARERGFEEAVNLLS